MTTKSNNTIKDRDEEIVSLEADNKRAKRLEAIFSGQGEANQGIFISPPMVQETVAALHESSAALSRVPGQQALSRRALSASAGIESLVIQFLAPVNKDQFDQAFSWRTGEPV